MERGKVSLNAAAHALQERSARAGGFLRNSAHHLRQAPLLPNAQSFARHAIASARSALRSPRVVQRRASIARAIAFDRYGVWYTLAFGMAGITLFIYSFNHLIGLYPNPGLLYLAPVAYIAYRWSWRYGVIAAVAQITCALFFFYPPLITHAGMSLEVIVRLATMVAGAVTIIALIENAKRKTTLASHEAGRYALLTHLAESLTQAVDEAQALRLATQAALACTSSDFAAVALARLPLADDSMASESGELYLAPANYSTIAEALNAGLAAPVSTHGPLAPLYAGKAVTIDDLDALDVSAAPSNEALRAMMRSLGPLDGARSVIAAPLIDHDGRTHGGIALGHRSPRHYTEDDLALLMGLSRLTLLTAENKQLLQTAQERAQELDIIFEQVGDAISLVDAQGKTRRENRAARKLRHAMTYGAWSDEEDGSTVSERARDVLHGMPFAVVDQEGVAREYEVRRATLVAPEAQAENGGDATAAITGALVVYRDVTVTRRLIEERRARAEAESRRALLQRVVDQIPVGVFLVSGPDARMALGNVVAMRMFGADCPIGMTIADFLEQSGVRIFRHDGTVMATEDLATVRTLATGESSSNVQSVMRQPSGATLSVLVNTVALDGLELGETVGDLEPSHRSALVVMQDVSAMKEVERLKDDFIAVAAHELKNPVAEIKGNVDTLLLQTARGKGQALDPWQFDAMEAIDRGATKLVHLTNDLLDVSRIQAGLLALRQEPHDLVALARRVVKSFQSASPKHTITFHAPAPYVVGRIDLRRTEQVLSNLIGNAVKYSPGAGLIEVTVEEREGEARVEVVDHGIGIPQEQQPLVFDRFVRADNARERRIEGNGLGLYLSRELVERHGGRIWFDSVVGKGTTFHVALPLFEA